MGGRKGHAGLAPWCGRGEWGPSLVPEPSEGDGPVPAETLADSDAGEQPSAGPARCPVVPGPTPQEGHGFTVSSLLSACSHRSQGRLREARSEGAMRHHRPRPPQRSRSGNTENGWGRFQVEGDERHRSWDSVPGQIPDAETRARPGQRSGGPCPASGRHAPASLVARGPGRPFTQQRLRKAGRRSEGAREGHAHT